MPDALFIFCFVRIERKSVFCLNTDLTKQQTETEVVFDSLNQSNAEFDFRLRFLKYRLRLQMPRISVFGFEKIGEFYENLGPYHSQVGVPFEAL